MNPPVAIPSSEAVAHAAASLARGLDALDDALLDIDTGWGALSTVYVAPEAEVAYAALAPLDAAAQSLHDALSRAVAALDAYATTLIGLETRRAALLADIAAVTVVGPPAPGAPTEHEVRMRRTTFDLDADEADRECARALRALREYDTWDVAAALDPVTGTPGGIVQGLAAELLQRYRGSLLVPGPGAVIPSELLLTPATINPDWTRHIIDGETWVQRPSGLLMPESSLLPDGPVPGGTRYPGWITEPIFADPSIGRPPAWASAGGKALNVVGAGLTYWSVYAESYNDTLTRHPDWTDDQRQTEALVDTAVVGSTAVAGGAGGAWAGAAAGAAIGSVFPGPGTLIGGIIGGVVGGVAGGWGGQQVGQSAVDTIRGDEDLDEMILAPGPIGVEPDGAPIL